MSDIFTWKPRLFKARSHVSTTVVDTDGATITFDCGAQDPHSEDSSNLVGADWHSVILGGNRTLALTNQIVDQQLTIVLQQDATGSRTVTWWSGILWPGGSAPTLTTTANKRDVFTFKVVSLGVSPVYLGFIAGQNL